MLRKLTFVLFFTLWALARTELLSTEEFTTEAVPSTEVITSTESPTTTEAPDLPNFICQDRDPNICYLKGIQLTKTETEFTIESIDRLTVQTIFVDESIIPIVSSSFCNSLPNLINIYINAAQVEEIQQDAFLPCQSLEFIDLHQNKIKQIPENLFSNSTKLQYLFLHSNYIRELPENLFINTPELNGISLGDNKLQNVPFEALRTNQKLQSLLIHTNDILTFDAERVVKQFPNLNLVAFNNNLLSCEIHLEIVDWFIEKGLRVSQSMDLRWRYVIVRKVGDVFCVGDVDWTGLYYKRVAEKSELENLKRRVEDVRSQLDDTMALLKESVSKFVEKNK